MKGSDHSSLARELAALPALCGALESSVRSRLLAFIASLESPLRADLASADDETAKAVLQVASSREFLRISEEIL